MGKLGASAAYITLCTQLKKFFIPCKGRARKAEERQCSADSLVATYGLGIFLIPKYISQAFALKASAILGIVFTFCIVFTTGFISVLFVAGLGIANALVWPAVWPLALNGLGKFTKTASALLIMAISGGAILPLLYGKLVDIKKTDLIAQGLSEVVATAASSTSGYWILLPCYLIILYYAFSGHKLGLKSS